MEKRAIIAIGLSVLILILYQLLFVKPKTPTKPKMEAPAKSVVEKVEKKEKPQKKEEEEGFF